MNTISLVVIREAKAVIEKADALTGKKKQTYLEKTLEYLAMKYRIESYSKEVSPATFLYNETLNRCWGR